MSLILLVLKAFAFVLGLAAIPIVAYTVAPMMRPLAETLSNVLFSVACLGSGPVGLTQTEADTYELRPLDEDLEAPPRKFTTWSFVKFAFLYDNSPEAWAHLHADVDLRELENIEDEIPDAGFSVAKSSIKRGGIESYVNNDAEGVRVRLAAALNRLKGTGHLQMAQQTISEGLKEHGGNTGSMGVKIQAGGMVLFTACGLGIGWVLFL